MVSRSEKRHLAPLLLGLTVIIVLVSGYASASGLPSSGSGSGSGSGSSSGSSGMGSGSSSGSSGMGSGSSSGMGGMGSSCMQPDPLVSGQMGTDVEEYATQPYCYIGPEMCCDISSVFMITQTYFDEYRKRFIMDMFYTCPVEIDLQKENDDVHNATIFQVGAMGAFLDASAFLDVLRTLQMSIADSVKEYTVSDQICRFGTLARSLSASDSRVDTNRLALSEIALSRHMGTMSSIASSGLGQDYESRLKVFAGKYCDLTDNASGMSGVCQMSPAISDLGQNFDVDYTRTIDSTPTINADFTNTSLTLDESNVIGLGYHLYGHRQPSKRMSTAEMSESGGEQSMFREYRSVLARRAAAQNTYHMLAAMRAGGSGASDTYLTSVMQSLGLSASEVEKYIRDKDASTAATQSSYYSQMEVLTKGIYQSPSFYANLMESKTNVARTATAIQGIGLMQGRDTYRSIQRSEMLLAILVELEAKKMVNNNLAPRGN